MKIYKISSNDPDTFAFTEQDAINIAINKIQEGLISDFVYYTFDNDTDANSMLERANRLSNKLLNILNNNINITVNDDLFYKFNITISEGKVISQSINDTTDLQNALNDYNKIQVFK